VSGIHQQREAASEPGTNHLSNQHGRRYRERDPQPGPVRPGHVMVMACTHQVPHPTAPSGSVIVIIGLDEFAVPSLYALVNGEPCDHKPGDRV
jgi:hypothetical protein